MSCGSSMRRSSNCRRASRAPGLFSFSHPSPTLSRALADADAVLCRNVDHVQTPPVPKLRKTLMYGSMPLPPLFCLQLARQARAHAISALLIATWPAGLMAAAATVAWRVDSAVLIAESCVRLLVCE